MFRSQSFPGTNIQQQLKIQTLNTWKILGNQTLARIIPEWRFAQVFAQTGGGGIMGGFCTA